MIKIKNLKSAVEKKKDTLERMGLAFHFALSHLDDRKNQIKDTPLYI